MNKIVEYALIGAAGIGGLFIGMWAQKKANKQLTQRVLLQYPEAGKKFVDEAATNEEVNKKVQELCTKFIGELPENERESFLRAVKSSGNNIHYFLSQEEIGKSNYLKFLEYIQENLNLNNNK